MLVVGGVVHLGAYGMLDFRYAQAGMHGGEECNSDYVKEMQG